MVEDSISGRNRFTTVLSMMTGAAGAATGVAIRYAFDKQYAGDDPKLLLADFARSVAQHPGEYALAAGVGFLGTYAATDGLLSGLRSMVFR